MIREWKPKLMFVAPEKILYAIAILTLTIQEDMLEDVLKTGVITILVDELKE